MFEIGFHDVSRLRSFFDGLPEDPYTDGGFRFRRLGNFKIVTDGYGYSWEQGEVGIINQPSEVNSYLGDITREYAALESRMLETPTFREMVLKFRDVTGWKGDFDLHQMRIKGPGEPAPEGIHRDGYEFIMAFMVNCTGTGGKPQIWSNDNKPLVNMQPIPNTYLLFRDREIQHFATPVKSGNWDAFVFAANKD